VPSSGEQLRGNPPTEGERCQQRLGSSTILEQGAFSAFVFRAQNRSISAANNLRFRHTTTTPCA